MSSAIPNLWPSDLAPTMQRTPLSILKEQATQLGTQTKNLLEGRVETTKDLDARDWDFRQFVFRHSFDVVAPALGDYKYELLVVSHAVEPYPLTAHFYGPAQDGPEHTQIASEAEFIDYLKKVFASDKTRRVIGALLAQIQS